MDKSMDAGTQNIKIHLLITFLLVVLCGCAQQGSHFAVQHLQTGSQDFNGAKLTYHPQNAHREIGLELCKTTEAFRLFLIIEGRPLKTVIESTQNVVVTLSGEGWKEQFTGYVYEGGQKILASLPLQEALLDKLNKQITVNLHCCGYKTILEPTSFNKAFAQLHTPPLKIPLQFGLEK